LSFDTDYYWQGRFIPEIKRLCADYLIEEAPVEEDRRHNTDLSVLRLDPIRVACRIRRFDYLSRYSDEFTIRSARPTGAVQTDLQKVLSGWGDYLFYGFAKQDDTGLAAWLLGDLKVFRLWHNQQLAKGKGRHPGKLKTNDDGTKFLVYSIAELPLNFVVSRFPVQRGVADDEETDDNSDGTL
jgi:hypothetical protein